MIPTDRRPARRKTGKWIAWGWTALLCAALFAQTYVRAERPGGIDLTSYLLSARAILHGASPYLLPTPFPYLYPATLAFLLIPLTFIPPLAALVVWFALNVAALVWSIRAVALRARPDLASRPGDAAVFIALFVTFFFSIVQSNLRNGQVNLIVLALALRAIFGGPERAALHPASPASPAPPALPALAWSLSIALKILPLVLLPYFAFRQSWRWLLASLAAIAAWCLLPAVVLGARVVDVYQQYWDVFLATALAPQVLPLDFSLAATIAWVTRAPLTPMLKASAAAAAIGWIVQRDARRMRGETLRPAALYLLAIPLASPHSEVHHLAFVLPAATLVAAALWERWRAAPRAQAISAAIAAGLYLVATAVRVAKGPLFCAALLALGAALVQVRLKPDPTDQTGPGAHEPSAGHERGGVRL